jgi:hypothetical protein
MKQEMKNVASRASVPFRARVQFLRAFSLAQASA